MKTDFTTFNVSASIAMNKQKPKKVKRGLTNMCAVCDNKLKDNQIYCDVCGQRQDWQVIRNG